MLNRLLSLQILVLTLALCISACQPKPQVQRAFYHWQTNLSLSLAEQKSLQKLQVSRLYAKFFDVDWDEVSGQIVPLASIQIDTAGLRHLELIPVIYITNRTWDHVESEAQVETLIQRIIAKIDALAQPLGKPNFPEIQIDCDWTAGSRRVYFAFLEKLSKKLAQRKCRVSATIRLHQYKYPQRTGIPPVASGTLMLYNVGDLESWEEENSIFSKSAVEAYAPFPKYALPLDVVLPAFSWGVLFREGEMIRLLNELRSEDLSGDARFEQIAPQRFRVQKSTYLNGYYLYQGDLLRIETCGYAELLAAARFARKHLPVSGLHWVAIYHWYPGLSTKIKTEELGDIFAVF
jgi:hypothetical protein